LDSSSDFFTGLDKEALRSSLENLLSKLVDTLLIDRVENVAELIFSQDSSHLLLNELFVHIKNVAACLFRGNKPLLTSLSFFSIAVSKSLLCLEEES